MTIIFLANITTFVHSVPLHPLLSLFPSPLLDYLQPPLQGAQPVIHGTRLIRLSGEQRQQDTNQHQAGKSNGCGVCSGFLVSHHQSKNPESQNGFHNPEDPPHHRNQQAEDHGQHPVADESQQTPLGECGHALWSEAGQRQCDCGGRTSRLGLFI